MASPVSSIIRVGILSENTALVMSLSSVLGSGFVVMDVGDPEPADKLAADSHFDALLLDLEPASPLLQRWASFLESAEPPVPVILLASDENRRQALAFVGARAHGYIRKPLVIPELRAMLRAAYERRSLRGELAAIRHQLENTVGLDRLIGSSASMQLVFKLVRKVANLDASVLIAGESGTGKELIARAIHNVGNRSKCPFVAVSCGAIPETLIESELFGHEKGAFTGSVGTREGYFEQAGNGTLFLDEIGELSLPIQVKLLRVLQQREFSRLGSSRPIPLKARLVFATHRDLENMVATGAFRQDLFYRVNVMNIEAPPLREHAQDIPLLVQHFLRNYSESYRKPIENIEPEALALLQRYNWPGNVRELENVMQRAIIMADGCSLEVGDLPETIREQEPSDLDDVVPAGSFERLLRDYKIKLATNAVEQCNGNKTIAAQSLSISRAYLHRLLRLASGPVAGVTEIGIANPPLTFAAGQ
jgi:DNA-binding NtrC family response regulator